MNRKSDFLVTDEKRAAFLRDSTWARQRQIELVPQSHAQNLAWTIIYIVTEGLLSGRNIFVTDVCHAVESSKSTVIKAIDRLVRDKMIDRQSDEIDRRRKILTINRTFKPKILSYIDETIARFTLSDILERIEDDTEFSTRQIYNLLSSLRNSPILIMIHAEDGEVLMISKEWERLTGYKHSEIPTIKKWTERAYGKNTKKNTMPEMRKLISNLHKIKSGDFEDSAHVHAKSGKVLTWNFRSAPLGKLADGRSNIITIASDIS